MNFIKKLVSFFRSIFSKLKLSNYINKRWLRWVLRFFILLILYPFAMQINFLWLFGYTPKVDELKNPQVAIATELYTKDGVLIGKFYHENRTPISYDKISPLLVDALISTEDIRFYEHSGLDMVALVSSLWSTVQGDGRGGSTITQQLVKNLFKTRKAKNQGILLHVPYINTFIYKTKEWITAYKLELFYSKQEILEMYFNTVDFGNNWFGIKVASQNYFSKTPKDLNLSECATLVGLLKATSTYNPIRNPKNATGRRNIVLSQMLKYEKISKKEYEKTIAKAVICKQPTNKNDEGKDSYIRQYVEKSLDEWCKKNGYDIYEDGLKIYTTIDSRLQNYAEDAVRWHMRKLQKVFNNQWGKNNPWRDADGNELKDFIKINIRKTDTFKILAKKYNNNIDSVFAALSLKRTMKVFTWEGPKEVEMSAIDSLSYYAKILNTGMMSMDPYTGEIRAYVGGIDFKFFKYDHVSQARRQPGSTFKPFAYLAALAQDSITLCDRFTDKPVKIEYEGGQIWEPKNSGNKFTYRSMNLRRAMATSCNSITAQLTEKIGWAKVIEYAHKAGIKSHLDSVPSICLGASDVSVNEMVRAYSTFMNKGVRSEPIIVSKILNSDGEILEEFKSVQEPVIDQQTAWLMCYMLLGGLQEPGGTSRALWGYNVFPNNNEIGGKTGTTSNYSDAWYMGMTTDLVTGVWVGADFRSVHFKSAIGQGSKAALPIFAKFLEMAYKDKKTNLKPGPFPKPWTEITKDYLCYSKYTGVIDTAFNDSLNFELRIDSIIKQLEQSDEQENKEVDANFD